MATGRCRNDQPIPLHVHRQWSRPPYYLWCVKISLIILFKTLHLHILIVARKSPGHSWANSAERIMSLLKLAYQTVALSRDKMPTDFEKMLKSVGSMKEIKKKAAKESGLQEEWTKPLGSMNSLLDSRTDRVVLQKHFRAGKC